jgi:hypothetical protein
LKPEAYNRSVERVYLDLCCLKRPEQADARLLTCDDRLLALAGRHGIGWRSPSAILALLI